MVFIGSNVLVQYCEIYLSHYPIICFLNSVCTLLYIYWLIVCTLYNRGWNKYASVLIKIKITPIIGLVFLRQLFLVRTRRTRRKRRVARDKEVLVDVAALLPGDIVEGFSEPTPLKHLEITHCRF